MTTLVIPDPPQYLNEAKVETTGPYYLYTPPSYQNVMRMQGALRYSVTVSLTVYRLNGVWHEVQTPADSEIDDADYVFNTPTMVPQEIADELTAYGVGTITSFFTGYGSGYYDAGIYVGYGEAPPTTIPSGGTVGGTSGGTGGTGGGTTTPPAGTGQLYGQGDYDENNYGTAPVVDTGYGSIDYGSGDYSF